MGRPPTGETFIARVRVPLPKWEAFEGDAADMGTDRSKLINELIDMIRRDPTLWRDARKVAAARGEVLGTAVIARALRSYISRNRDLLGE